MRREGERERYTDEKIHQIQDVDRICIDLPPLNKNSQFQAILIKQDIYSDISETDDCTHDTRKKGIEIGQGWTLLSHELILSQNFSNVNALWRVAHNTVESSSPMLHETDRERYGSVCAPVNGVTWYLARYNGCHRTVSLQTVFLIATIFDRVSADYS